MPAPLADPVIAMLEAEGVAVSVSRLGSDGYERRDLAGAVQVAAAMISITATTGPLAVAAVRKAKQKFGERRVKVEDDRTGYL